MGLKDIIHQCSPPAFSALYGRTQDFLARTGIIQPNGLILSGPYESWDDAMRSCTGYDADLILEKTKNSLLKVRNGEAVYERDSVLFDEVRYSWELLAGMMWVAAQSGGKLHVLDLGGSLGSTYFQNKKFLDPLPEVRWNVVEQPKHVEAGREFFSNEYLRYYHSIDECTEENPINLVILSGVLQYLEGPYGILKRLMAIPGCCIIIDRTPFYEGPTDQLFLQTVPPCIYPATYPCWIFSNQRFRSVIQGENRKIHVEFDALDHIRNPVGATWHGMVLIPQ